MDPDLLAAGQTHDLMETISSLRTNDLVEFYKNIQTIMDLSNVLMCYVEAPSKIFETITQFTTLKCERCSFTECSTSQFIEHLLRCIPHVGMDAEQCILLYRKYNIIPQPVLDILERAKELRDRHSCCITPVLNATAEVILDEEGRSLCLTTPLSSNFTVLLLSGFRAFQHMGPNRLDVNVKSERSEGRVGIWLSYSDFEDRVLFRTALGDAENVEIAMDRCSQSLSGLHAILEIKDFFSYPSSQRDALLRDLSGGRRKIVTRNCRAKIEKEDQ